MKAKLNLDQAKIKQFFLLHAEKIVFGAVLICFFWLCYSALNLKPYQRRPEDLLKLAADRQERIRTSEVDMDKVGIRIPPFTQMARVANKTIDPQWYPLVPFDPASGEIRTRRGEPKYVAVGALIAKPGYGAIAWSEQGGHWQPPGALAGGAGGAGAVGGLGAGMGEGMGERGGMGAGMGAGMEGMRGGAGMEGMRGGAGMEGRGGAGMEGMGGGAGMEGMRGGAGIGGRGMQPGTTKGKAAARRRQKEEEEKPTTPTTPAEQRLVPLPSGAEPRGMQWVAVMGLVPTWEQAGEYRKVFQNATAVSIDVPMYYNFEVQIQPDGEGDWIDVPVDQILIDIIDHYATNHPEVIDPNYVEPLVCDPIPPVVSKNLDPRSVSHPDIPLAVKFAAPAPAAAKEDEKPAEEKATPLSRSQRARRPAAATASRSARAATSASPRIEYKQFRFFDFTVEPGKTYRYRVRLVLRNPNYGVAARYLESKDLAVGETRLTEWSEPTEKVFVPHGSEILAGEVNPASGSRDATVSLMVSQFEKEKGVEVARLFNVPRGTFANFSEEVPVPSPRGAPSMGEARFATDSLIVDFIGGERLLLGGKPKKSPGRLLVLGPDGNLAIRSQVKDLTGFEAELKRQEDLKRRAEGRSDGSADKGDKQSDPFSDFGNLKPGGGKKSRR